MDPHTVKEHYFASMTPKEQVLALLDRAVSDMTQAIDAFTNRRFEDANRLLINAQNIFEELGGMLRGEDAWSRRGAQLFALFSEELFYANLNRDLERLAEVRDMTQRLKINYEAALGKFRFD